jgi:adenylate cyclase
MMAKLPADRPRSGAEVVQQIDALLAGAPATIAAPATASPASASPRPARRARGPWLAGAAVALLAIGAIGVWTFRGDDTTAAPAVSVARPAPPAPVQQPKSIAVLPFVNMSSDKENEYFADGISEEILNQLAQLKTLRVAGRTSSFSFKGKDQDLREIGRRLGVAYVLEGSVRKSASTVRVTAQLVQVADGFHVWSETYDRELSDIFKVQDEISRAVLDAMKANLLGDQQPRASRTTSVAAYNLYLQAQASLFKRGTENLQAAQRQFEAALAIDPDYVPALVGLARTLSFMPGYGRYRASERDAMLDASARAARRALELDPDNPAAHALLAYRAMRDHQWAEADAGFTRALALAPNDGEILNIAGDFYVQTRDPVRAIATELRALELNPLSPVHHWEAGIAHAVFGEFASAVPYLTAGNALAPEVFRPYFILVWTYGELKRFDEMDAVIANARRFTHAPEEHFLFLELWAAMAEGRRDDALQLLARLEPFAAKDVLGPRSWVGYAYLTLGESEKAAYWLQEAVRVGDDSFWYPDPFDLSRLHADPKTRVLFHDPQLKALLDLQRANARSAGKAP